MVRIFITLKLNHKYIHKNGFFKNLIQQTIQPKAEYFLP